MSEPDAITMAGLKLIVGELETAREEVKALLERRDRWVREALSVGYKPGVVAEAAKISRQQLKNVVYRGREA